MRPRTLAILAAVVAALAAFVYLYERELPSSDERRELEKKVFRLEPDELEALTVKWQGKAVKLEREAPPATDAEAPPAAAGWRIVEPYTGRADRTLADRLAGDLAALEIVRTLDGAASADVGLEPPRGELTWKTATAAGTLTIGGDVPASSNVVVAASGRSAPLVVARGFVADLDRPPGDWRAKELLAVGREAIERIRIVPRDGEEVVLVRRGEGYVVERPFADLADRDFADPLAGELAGLRAERFLDAPLAGEAEAGLAGGPGRLELAIAGRTAPLVVEVGAETATAGERYLRADGQAVVARTRLADSFGGDPTRWRSRSWTTFESWRAERLRIEDGAGQVELVRSGGEWTRDGARMPYTEVGDLLYAVTSARADQVVPPEDAADYPAAAPELTVVLSDAGGAEETMTLHAARDGRVPARVSGRDVVLLLPPGAAAEVREKLAALRAAKPIEAPAAVVEGAP